MDFTIPERAQEFLPKVEDFVRTKLQPMEIEVLHKGFTTSLPRLDELRDEVRAMGMWAPQLPTELGGMGLNLVEHGMMSEALGHSPIGHYVFNCQAPDAGNMEILHKFGTDAQKEEWLAPLSRGEIRSCFSMTEPENAGSNPTRMSCTAALCENFRYGKLLVTVATELASSLHKFCSWLLSFLDRVLRNNCNKLPPMRFR